MIRVAVALTISCGPALAIAVFEEHQRTRALAGYAAMASLAGVIAPIIGGASVAMLGWPGVYWFRLPVVLLALACLPLLGPDIGKDQGAAAHAVRPCRLGAVVWQRCVVITLAGTGASR